MAEASTAPPALSIHPIGFTVASKVHGLLSKVTFGLATDQTETPKAPTVDQAPSQATQQSKKVAFFSQPVVIGKRAFPVNPAEQSKKRGLEEMEAMYLEKRPQIWAPSKESNLPPISYLPDFQVLEGKTPYLQKEPIKPIVEKSRSPECPNPYIPSPEQQQ